MRPSQIRNLIVLSATIAFLFWASGTVADFVIEYNWWRELGQVSTWVGMLWYSIAQAAAGSLVAFIALWVAHARGLQFAGIRRQDYRLYSRLIPFRAGCGRRFVFDGHHRLLDGDALFWVARNG